METGLVQYQEVHRWAYDYSKTDAEGEYIIPGQDYVPQTVPLKDGEGGVKSLMFFHYIKSLFAKKRLFYF